MSEQMTIVLNGGERVKFQLSEKSTAKVCLIYGMKSNNKLSVGTTVLLTVSSSGISVYNAWATGP